MRDVSIDSLTQAFIDYCGPDTDERLMFVLRKLVEHLHAFTKETQLTHDEWRRAMNLS